MIKNIEFKGIRNARDFSYLTNKDGKRIKPCFVRSAGLYKAKKSDIRILSEKYNIKTVIDLRTGVEKAQKPDKDIDGAKRFEIPLFREERLGVSHGKKLESIEMLDHLPDMCRLYRNIVTNDFSVSRLKKEFEIILSKNENDGILWHCTEGKDRCGITSAIFLSILDVDRKDIVEDYKFTTNCSKRTANRYYFLIRYILRKKDVAKRVRKIYYAEPEYLEAAFSAMEESSGSVDAYLEQKLGISAEKKAEFRKKYLVD